MKAQSISALKREKKPSKMKAIYRIVGLGKIEGEILKLQKKKLSSREALSSSASDEHYTPKGSIHLDSASCEIAQE